MGYYFGFPVYGGGGEGGEERKNPNSQFTGKNNNPNKPISIFFPSLQIPEITYRNYALKESQSYNRWHTFA